MKLYQNESSDPKCNAQRNLRGRTYYVDDDTLRFHKSRVLFARPVDDGLLFAIITSDALDMQGTKRGFRYVIFDVFGNTFARPELEQSFRTREQASKAMWAKLNDIDAVAVTRAAIETLERGHVAEMARAREVLDQRARDVAKVA